MPTRFAIRRGYAALGIGLPESGMRDMGEISVALEIGQRVALVPVTQRGDKDPQAEADIILPPGPQRVLDERFLRQSPAESARTR